MVKFTDIRKELRSLYKPRNKLSKQKKAQGYRNDVREALRVDSVISQPSITGHGSPVSFRDLDAKTEVGHEVEQPFPVGLIGSADSPIEQNVLLSPATIGTVSTDAVSNHMTMDLQTTGLEPTSFEEGPEDTATVDAQPHFVTPQETNAARAQHYATFAGEALEDYTEGPVRFTITTDGLRQCVALFMTMEFSQAVQAAVQTQREWYRWQDERNDKSFALMELKRQAREGFASVECKLEDIEEREDADQGEVQKLQQQLAVLELMIPSIEAREQSVQAEQVYRTDTLRAAQEVVSRYLEEAFQCGLLIEPELSPEEDKYVPVSLDLETEYNEFCEKLKHMNDPLVEVDDPEPLDLSRHHVVYVPLTGEEKVRQEIVNEHYTAKIRLQEAQNDFDRREWHRNQEYQENKDAADRGKPTKDADPEAFDIRWVQRNQELTRALIEAEAALRAARDRARDANVDLYENDDQSSGFGDHDDDGYRISAEHEMMATIPSPKVKNWLADIPEDAVADFMGETEGDYWDSEEVDISDSVSLVAEGRERTRIDQWRRVCEPVS